MNHYHAGTGRREYRPEPERAPQKRSASPLPPQEPREHQSAPPPPSGEGTEKNTKVPPGPLRDLGRGLDGILQRLDPGRLETEDLLVLAILWLLYRESGDKELLIALVAYLFL